MKVYGVWQLLGDENYFEGMYSTKDLAIDAANKIILSRDIEEIYICEYVIDSTEVTVVWNKKDSELI